MNESHSAVGPSLGYLYQVRYALYLLLQRDGDDAYLSIEWLDDVALVDENNSTPLELLQLKYSINAKASVTDASPQLWKTLYIWSKHIKGGTYDFSDLTLTLITTATASDNSVVAMLRPSASRDSRSIANKLTEVAQTSKNSTLQTSFKLFLDLTPSQREALVNCIQVLDAAPNIIDLESKIKNRLHAIRRPYRQEAYTKLEGWWFAKSVDHLVDPSTQRVISLEELDNRIAEIADEYGPNNLPIDFFPATDQTPEIPADTDSRIFVQQLRAVGINTRYLERCILDYYSAFEQRARWIRKNLVVDGEIERYERTLVHEWELFSEICLGDLGDNATEEELRQCGLAILNQMQTKDIRIREKVQEPYVMRGSFHILADDLKGVPPLIHWRPDFVTKLEQIFTQSGG